MAVAAVPIGMAVLGGAMSVAGGVAQAGAYKTQAAQYQQQERMAAVQARSDEANRLTQLNQAIGSNRALAAAGNIAVDSPTSMALEDANRDLATRSLDYMRLQTQVEQQRLASAAAADQANATWSVIGGIMKGASSIYGGVSQAGLIGGPAGATSADIGADSWGANR